MGGCEDCARKRRGEPGLTVRVVQERESLVADVLYGLAMSLGLIAGVKLASPFLKKSERRRLAAVGDDRDDPGAR